MADTRKPALTVNADEIEVSQILLKLDVLFSESESRRYCFRVNWGSQRRRSNPLPKPFKAMGSQKINLKRKRESGDAKEHVSDATKFFNLWFKERKHDNLVAPTGIQMIGRKSVTVNKGANLTTSQGGLNNMEKSKGKVVSTACKVVGRKALADVSNVEGNSSRNVVQDGPKLMMSLPEMKRVNQAATSIPKENAGNSDNGKERSGYLASDVGKPGKEVAPQVNNARNHLWKNRVRDGFKIIVDWGSRRRRSNPLPKPFKAKGSQKMNLKRKRESGDAKEDVFNLWLKERKHDNLVAPTGIQMIERKSVTVNKGANLTTSQGGLNNMEKSKGKVVSSTACKVVGRKALADVSNVEGNSSRNVVQDGPKLMMSLPELKRVNQAATSIPKENAGNSDKGKERSGYLASDVGKPGKEVAPQVNNARNHLWKNRVSDGFKIMEARALPRKSIRPIVKTTLQNTKVQRTSKSKNKEDIAIVVPHEAAQGQLSFGADGNPRTVSDIISRRKLDRRRSYTSSLMLLEKCEVMKLETLPIIDDNRNQLEVAEYVDEIYQYYWDKEAQNLSSANYISIQTNITAHMRGELINLLMKVHFKFSLMQETLYLMVTLLDRYLSQARIENNELLLVGLTALWLASKYEEGIRHLRVKDLISIPVWSYTRDQILGMEWRVLKQLNFRLNVTTPYMFMLLFLKASQSDTKLEHLAFYLIELCSLEYEALEFKPSLLCASAIYVARCALHMTPTWTPLLRKHARYEESQLRDCAKMILRFHKAAGTGHSRFTYQKYMMPDLSGIAAITALDWLPL